MPADEMSELMRILGRIEGAVAELTRRADDSDRRNETAISGLQETISGLAEKVSGLELTDAKRKGGYATLSALTLAAGSIGGLLVRFWHA